MMCYQNFMLSRVEQTVPMRDRIRRRAQELYMRGGYEGFSFGDIAAALDITRANIHYHFGSKRQLMAAMIDGFVDDALSRIVQHWTSPGQSFAERLQAQCSDLKAFHHHYNPEPGQRHVWSPVSRLRLDLPVLGDLAIAALDRVNHGYNRCLLQAVTEAIAAGELRADAPVDDIVPLLRTTIMSCGPMTQDHGSFAEVEALFATIGRTIASAWGTASLRHSLT
jgi:AcrR family transcriptional regulator